MRVCDAHLRIHVMMQAFPATLFAINEIDLAPKSILHRVQKGDVFDYRQQLADLDYITASLALVENYVWARESMLRHRHQLRCQDNRR
jgi:hypothetical protein